MNFQSVTIEKFCPALTYDFRIKHLQDTPLIDILIIAFHGTYRNGSSGKPDAGLIKGIITTGLAIFDPFSLLVDLRDMEYNWGDNFDLTFDEAGHTTSAILVGEKCRRAMSTLSFGTDTEKDIVDNEFFFDNFDKAIEKITAENNQPSLFKNQ